MWLQATEKTGLGTEPRDSAAKRRTKTGRNPNYPSLLAIGGSSDRDAQTRLGPKRDPIAGAAVNLGEINKAIKRPIAPLPAMRKPQVPH